MIRSDQEAEILAANQAFYDAFHSLDLQRMAAIWSEASPLSCVHPAWDLIEGREEVLASWKRIFESTSSIAFDLRDVHAFVSGDTGWVFLIQQIEATHGDERVAASTQATNVFVRENGRWRLVHHHSAAIRLPPEKPKPLLN